MKVFLGVDHGQSGALSAITEDGVIQSILKMPFKDGKINCFEVYSWLYENYGDYEHDVVACGEQLNAIFRASASTTFSFGKNIGKITGIIECLEMEYIEVRASVWQKYIFDKYEIPEVMSTKKTPSGKLRKDTKGMALAAASAIWGCHIDPYIKHDGVIDSLLIAEYTRMNHGK